VLCSTWRSRLPTPSQRRPDGTLKVLDFGLAKLAEEGASGVETQAPTSMLTREGLVVGTVPYMSPEQVGGEAVDHRSDLFSLGVMLYEMATGERPFRGDTEAVLASSILRDEPSSVSELNPKLPAELAGSSATACTRTRSGATRRRRICATSSRSCVRSCSQGERARSMASAGPPGRDHCGMSLPARWS